ncbi:MAG: DNA-processing protein DprA [Clostridia bacterium]|nr:DNA-processing protein DprA [Clostridia bacterium]
MVEGSEHRKLMECIEQNGLLSSEYPPGTCSTKYAFPSRNRLNKAAVIVTEKNVLYSFFFFC